VWCLRHSLRAQLRHGAVWGDEDSKRRVGKRREAPCPRLLYINVGFAALSPPYVLVLFCLSLIMPG
jgi:hypothetical protein